MLYPFKIVVLIVLCFLAVCAVAIAQDSVNEPTAAQVPSEGQVGGSSAEPMREADTAPGLLDFLFSWKYVLFFVFAAIGLVLLLGSG